MGREVRVSFHCEAEAAVRELIRFVGEDPEREGLVGTPDRVARAYTEMCRGYQMDPKKILSATFEDRYDEMVVLRNIRFTSICEHHLLPFIGEAVVAYIPRGRVVGISKLARLVECFACRLQIQERLTNDIAKAIMEYLDPLGVGVVIRAHHSCMGCRGVRLPESNMVTSALHGIMRGEAREEFLRLAKF